MTIEPNTLLDIMSHNKEDTGRVNCFLDPESGSLRTMLEENMDPGGMQCISVPTDPGASDSVLPIDECKDAPAIETRNFKAGYAHEVAGGHRIANERQKGMVFCSQVGS